ncbi:MAG: 3-methyl-2-oxobutanoate hydroxymethyltransferase, partial [Ktedonobacterales bacterium]
MGRVTPDQIRQMKARGERIPMLTAYDYATAQILDAAGVSILLVGDSMGMVMLGYDSTLPVTVDDIIRHTQAVVRGSKNAL